MAWACFLFGRRVTEIENKKHVQPVVVRHVHRAPVSGLMYHCDGR
jgi:hypothetical protein